MKKHLNKRLPYNAFKWKHDPKDKPKAKKIKISDNAFIRVAPIPNKSKNWNFYATGMRKYLSDHQELLLKDSNDKTFDSKNIQSRDNYLSYMSRDSAKLDQEFIPSECIWHYSNLKQYSGKDVATNLTANRARYDLCNLSEVRKVHNNSHIWSIVISEKDLNKKEIMFKHQHQIVDAAIRAMFDFPVDAVMAFHGNTEHPHIHIMVYQPEIVDDHNIRRVYKIKPNKLSAVKKSYMHFLTTNQHYLQKLILEKHRLKELYNNEVLLRTMQNRLIDVLKVLSKNRTENEMTFQYNRLDKESKQKVDQTRKYILGLPTNKQEILEFQQQYLKIQSIAEILIEKEFIDLPKSQRDAMIEKTQAILAEADEKINQQILKSVKDLYLQNKNVLKTSGNDFETPLSANHSTKNSTLKPVKPGFVKVLLSSGGPIMDNLYQNINKSINVQRDLSALRELMKKVKQQKNSESYL